MALAQLEYRADLHLGSGIFSRLSRGWWGGIFQSPAAWVLFTDAGRGWLVGRDRIGSQYPAGSVPSPSTFKTDAGAGIDFDVVALFVAKALSDWGEPPNFLIRLRHRF
jgi:hypothetical protein